MQYQWDALSALTGSVDLVCSSKQGPVLNGELAQKYQITGRWFDSLNHYSLFYEYVARLANTERYDFLYIRYPLALPSFLRFLRRVKKANPKAQIIVEIATFPYRRELRAPKQRILLALDDLGHGRLKDYVDAIVTFYGQPEIFGVPCLQMQNGVDVTRIALSEHSPIARAVRNDCRRQPGGASRSGSGSPCTGAIRERAERQTHDPACSGRGPSHSSADRSLQCAGHRSCGPFSRREERESSSTLFSTKQTSLSIRSQFIESIFHDLAR